MDYTVHGILQARVLEWLPFPSPGDLPKPGIKQGSPALKADSLPTELSGKPFQRVYQNNPVKLKIKENKDYPSL